ncbi:MAG: helix-turn-helix transcriptional regulator [Chlorobi bacterium]|nr:helix-turn-helix transcriptional regulator [Chlorobiota bacterium]
MERLEIDNILKVNELNSELEFERATNIYGRLRWMAEEDKTLKPVREHLRYLIKSYEDKFWGDEDKISNKQIQESDVAEKIVQKENEFIQRRKELIRENIKKSGIKQKDLAEILGHRPNYMSELINGIRPFSRDDIVVIHRLFGIDFKDLIPQFLKDEMTTHIKLTLGKLKNKKVKLRIDDLLEV